MPGNKAHQSSGERQASIVEETLRVIQPLLSGGKDERRRDHKTRAACDIEGSSSGPGSG